jgi:2-dehydropantoate 2-reductase
LTTAERVVSMALAMRIVVMGTGGTGGYFGAKLARAGEDVTFVARGAHLEAIQARGLTVRSTAEGEWTVRAPAVERLDGQPPADLVLFCVKSYDTETAAAAIRPVVGPDTAVLSIQNGVDSEATLGRLLGASRVLGGVAVVFAVLDGPGVVAHRAAGRIAFGEMDDRVTPRARAVLAALERAGIPAEIAPSIARALWEKYVFLAAHAGMTALLRCPVGAIRELPAPRRMYRALLEEMTALGRAEGVALPADFVDASMAQIDGLAPGVFSSLHHDLVHGRRLELEALHGHAVRLGEARGVPMPTVFAVYAALSPNRDGPPRALAP